MTSDEVPSPVVIGLALMAAAAAVASSWRAAAFTAWFGWPGVPALWTLLTGAVPAGVVPVLWPGFRREAAAVTAVCAGQLSVLAPRWPRSP